MHSINRYIASNIENSLYCRNQYKYNNRHILMVTRHNQFITNYIQYYICMTLRRYRIIVSILNNYAN